MNGLIELIDGGLGNSIQDAGRHGYRHMGIAVSGFADPMYARCANRLVGNTGDEACVEIRGVGPGLAVRQGPVRMALTGQVSAVIVRAGGAQQVLDPWHSATLENGDQLKIGAVKHGTAYLALSGGIGVPLALGSRSTYQRAGLGGMEGRLLRSGDALPCARLNALDSKELRAEPWSPGEGPIRIVPGPQAGHFAEAALATLLGETYAVTAESDRMGMRLSGPVLAHRRPECADIVSDGVTPGAIQVPGNGLPIILLADCQTVGGYPKIATVITADLGRLAQMRPGQAMRFEAVTLAEAQAARHQCEADWQRWSRSVSAYLPAGYLDEIALYSHNLISGMVRADR